MREYNFSYDKENDDLFLFRPQSKSKGGVEFGDLILDFDNKKQLVGIQLLNASKFLKEIISKQERAGIKDVLSNLDICKIDVKTKNNLLIIKMFLIGNNKELSPIMSIPTITEPSPALAYS